MTGFFTPQRSVDQDEAGQVQVGRDLTGRRDADQQPATGGEELLGDPDGEGRADGAADHADAHVVDRRFPQVGVVARPDQGARGASSGLKMPSYAPKRSRAAPDLIGGQRRAWISSPVL